MSWLRKMATVIRQLTVRQSDGWVQASSVADSGELVTDRSALALSTAWSCVNLIAGTTATLPLMVYSSRDGDRVQAKDHPLYRLLHDSPNFDQTPVDFWEFTSAALELWGNAFALIARNGETVTALTPIAPGAVSVCRISSGSLEYSWHADGQHYVRNEKDILHIRGFGGDPLGGLSTLQFGKNVFGLARAVDKAAGSTFKNGMRPSGALVFDNFLSPDNRKTAQETLTDRFVGAVNSGRPIILEGGTKWQPFTMNPEDAQMLETRRFSVEEVCRIFGVPPHMVGHTEKSTSWGTGLEQQTLAFQKFTLRRRLRRIEQALQKQLLTPRDRAAGVTIEFNLEGLLRGDSKSRSAFYQSALGSGWMTINEVRQKENLPPVDGGDVPRMQIQNVPITEAGANDDS